MRLPSHFCLPLNSPEFPNSCILPLKTENFELVLKLVTPLVLKVCTALALSWSFPAKLSSKQTTRSGFFVCDGPDQVERQFRLQANDKCPAGNAIICLAGQRCSLRPDGSQGKPALQQSSCRMSGGPTLTDVVNVEFELLSQGPRDLGNPASHVVKVDSVKLKDAKTGTPVIPSVKCEVPRVFSSFLITRRTRSLVISAIVEFFTVRRFRKLNKNKLSISPS